MTKILFICHGNICRSPMAEFIFNDICKKRGITDAFAESAATSREEIGNDVYPPAKAKLREKGIPFERRYARQATPGDYSRYSLFVCMDRYNVKNLTRIFGGDPEGKIRLLSDFTRSSGSEISDPWYSGDFETAFRDILEGCEGLAAYVAFGPHQEDRC